MNQNKQYRQRLKGVDHGYLWTLQYRNFVEEFYSLPNINIPSNGPLELIANGEIRDFMREVNKSTPVAHISVQLTRNINAFAKTRPSDDFGSGQRGIVRVSSKSITTIKTNISNHDYPVYSQREVLITMMMRYYAPLIVLSIHSYQKPYPEGTILYGLKNIYDAEGDLKYFVINGETLSPIAAIVDLFKVWLINHEAPIDPEPVSEMKDLFVFKRMTGEGCVIARSDIKIPKNDLSQIDDSSICKFFDYITDGQRQCPTILAIQKHDTELRDTKNAANYLQIIPISFEAYMDEYREKSKIYTEPELAVDFFNTLYLRHLLDFITKDDRGRARLVYFLENKITAIWNSRTQSHVEISSILTDDPKNITGYKFQYNNKMMRLTDFMRVLFVDFQKDPERFYK